MGTVDKPYSRIEQERYIITISQIVLKSNYKHDVCYEGAAVDIRAIADFKYSLRN